MKKIFEIPFIIWNVIALVIIGALYVEMGINAWSVVISICYVIISIFWIRDNLKIKK